MKLKTSELSGNALDWAVAKCEKKKIHCIPALNYPFLVDNAVPFQPSVSHSDAGPIIEANEINTSATGGSMKWKAYVWVEAKQNFGKEYFGKTHLIAAMRCYVASKLGEEVEIPDSIISNLT